MKADLELKDLDLEILIGVARNMQERAKADIEKADKRTKEAVVCTNIATLWEAVENHLKELETFRAEPVIHAQKQFERES